MTGNLTISNVLAFLFLLLIIVWYPTNDSAYYFLIFIEIIIAIQMFYPIFYNIFFAHSTGKKFKTRNEIIKDKLINKGIVNNYDNSNAINYGGLTQLDNLNQESSTISWDIIHNNLGASGSHILRQNNNGNLEYVVPKYEKIDLRKNSKLSLGPYILIGIILFMFSFSVFVGQKNGPGLLGTLIASIIFGGAPIFVYTIFMTPLVNKNINALDKYVVFEKEKQIFYNGTYNDYKSKKDVYNNSIVEFKNIRAVQVISIKNTLRRRTINYYQINLILKDTSRVNIYSTNSYESIITKTDCIDSSTSPEMDYIQIGQFVVPDFGPSVEQKMGEEAKMIGEFLGVPVWDMSNIKESGIV